ncbi:sirohydrochlorin chelatase [Chamaesiphon sp. OTE_20_metabat_361]|uniref:sirohydrochlorin chelatase n=1 Tax=Chamaesiphon sp. OTE_20_metabat_361 TaxID=2964689 RepID=UPI00286D31E2|nr:sirohydrochlorin chelatase [Chamaesiphon sp. OTE_20_metabat_361]
MTDAYLLVSHGSRDPRPQIATSLLAEQLSLWLQNVGGLRSPLVAAAQLELAAVPLHRQIGNFASQCQQQEIDRVVILPLFLIPGVHVMEDIPAEVALAELEIGDKVNLVVADYLGANADFINLFARNRSGLPDRSIILAHGSRRSGSNQIVERLAHDLDLTPAYWSVAPSLADRVTMTIATGATEIGILPYFLFSGGITDAISAAIAQLRMQFPEIKLIFGEPIGNSPALAATIGKIFAAQTSAKVNSA